MDEPHAIATMVALSTENAIRQAARMALLQAQTDQALQKSLLHRTTSAGTRFTSTADKGKRAMKMWLRPCTAIGAKGQKHMGEPGRSCLLCAAEHMRPRAYAPGERLNRRCGRKAFAEIIAPAATKPEIKR